MKTPRCVRLMQRLRLLVCLTLLVAGLVLYLAVRQHQGLEHSSTPLNDANLPANRALNDAIIDVSQDVTALRTREDILIPFFRQHEVKAVAGLSVRRDVPLTEFERQLLATPPLPDFQSAPDELKSKVWIVRPQTEFRIGDRLLVRADLFDGRGRIRTEGGDEVRMWLTSPTAGSNVTSVAATVVDMRNGSYVGETTLQWAGPTHVRVSLTYAREFLRALVVLRHTVHSMRWITATFDDGRGARETTVCLPSAPVPGFAGTCNLTSRNGDVPWHCGRPVDPRLTCGHWAGTGNMPYTPLGSLPQPERRLVQKVDSKPYFKLIPNSITLITKPAPYRTPKENLPRCQESAPRVTWESARPRGWFEAGSWRPSTCAAPELTPERVRKCVRNTTLVFLGDCNMRKWWLAVRHFLPCSKVKEGTWHAPMLCEVEKSGSTVLFAPHAMPFNVGTHTDLHTLPLSAALARIPRDRRPVVVLHYYLHTQNYPVHAYVDRARAARRAMEGFLRSRPDALFFVRGPHAVYDGRGHHANFGDSFAPQYVRVWEEELRPLRDHVRFLDFWDMSVAAENCGQNPVDSVDLQMLKVLFGYWC